MHMDDSATSMLLISREETSLATEIPRLAEEDILVQRLSEWRLPAWPAAQKPDLVLLDITDAKRDSLSLCAEIRRHYDGPLMILTATAEETFHILGFELGADDVVAKPVSHGMLKARIKALTRRGRQPGSDAPVVRHGDLTLDGRRREVRKAGAIVPLTTIEFDLLWFLANRAGSVVSRDEIHRALYASSYNGFNRAIDLYIFQLRHKLGDKPARPRYLKTVRGVGYLFAPFFQI
ncbi:MAG TPA: response regulator transcription factor [Desulfuromonadales bacterium]|nr:response regulator transcription factor [Desulfuromonadales bacterium]